MKTFSDLFEASKARRQNRRTSHVAAPVARAPRAQSASPRKNKSHIKMFIKDRLHANLGVLGKVLGHWMGENTDDAHVRVNNFLKSAFGDKLPSKCSHCHGSGSVKTGHPSMNVQKKNIRKCKKCNGTGRIHESAPITKESLKEADTTLHRALGKLGYSRPLDKDGQVDEPNVYKHRKDLGNDHFAQLGQALEKMGFVHNPAYDEDTNGIVHRWERAGQKVHASPEYLKGHSLEIEGA